MSKKFFFEKKGPFPLKEISKIIGIKSDSVDYLGLKIFGLESLVNANKKDMTFLNSRKYKEASLKTKASACITSTNLEKFLPDSCIKLSVPNVLFAVTQVSSMFYPNAEIDYPDKNLIESKNLIKLYPDVFFGSNVLIGKNVKIGSNTYVSSNSIIESNVSIGKNCVIGALVTIRSSIIFDDVVIQDGSKIGVKGFGFIPNTKKNIKSPHIGKVIIENGVEIGANSTVDRGSLSDTVIGQNTFIDNQVHIAHNVKIGKNCMIAGQVGFAGSTTIGDNVVIGGQAGISGHLKIGNDVKIGGGSKVIHDIESKNKVMGYPAVPLKDFINKNK